MRVERGRARVVEAELLLADYQRRESDPRLLLTRIYLRCLANELDEAEELVEDNREWFDAAPGAQSFLRWLHGVFGFTPNS